MSEKKAFTLIEMLIVIAIIAMLAMLAVGAYGSARRSAQIDLVADSLVSALKMQQSASKSGKVLSGNENDPAGKPESASKCYGMYFKKKDSGDTVPQIQYVETPYYAVHPSKPEADVCELEGREVRAYETDADFDLFLIRKYRPDDESDEILILFKPPFARVVTGDMNGVAAPGIQMSPFIEFGVRLSNGENEKFFRIDTSTGLTERIYGEQV